MTDEPNPPSTEDQPQPEQAAPEHGASHPSRRAELIVCVLGVLLGAVVVLNPERGSIRGGYDVGVRVGVVYIRAIFIGVVCGIGVGFGGGGVLRRRVAERIVLYFRF